jgi:site-specific DNA-methyltransferase (adenine-specific)
MEHQNTFFTAIGLNGSRSAVASFAKESGLSIDVLRHFNDTTTLPTGSALDKVCITASITPVQLMLRMGKIDRRLEALLRDKADAIHELLDGIFPEPAPPLPKLMPDFKTEFGELYQADCLRLLSQMPSDSIDLCIADPPFNLDKLYPSKIDDNLRESQYIEWCEAWASECVRVLKPGGSLFIWNLPKWNTVMSAFLNDRLTFRHWIAVDIKYRLPIAGRLYPSHYSLLYYCKGPKPTSFHPDRLPMEVCPSCAQDLRDYGGYKDKMNPSGVNLADVWYDIPPVRHAKYKRREGANELSIKLLDRIIEMASEEGDVVFDPFGGAGTTYVVAEMKLRRWIGSEIGPLSDIIDRFAVIDEERDFLRRYREGYNKLFTHETLRTRRARGLWTPESVRSKRNGSDDHQIVLALPEDAGADE